MKLGFAIVELKGVKATDVRFGNRGWVVNRFAHNQPVYASQFPDKCNVYFDRWELETIPENQFYSPDDTSPCLVETEELLAYEVK